MTWPTNGEVALTWENRHQNYSVVSVCEALSGKTMPPPYYSLITALSLQLTARTPW